jgi:hypothetical protein
MKRNELLAIENEYITKDTPKAECFLLIDDYVQTWPTIQGNRDLSYEKLNDDIINTEKYEQAITSLLKL